LSGDHSTRSYIRLAQEEQQQYAQTLLAENEQLRRACATLDSDKRRSDEECRIAVAELEALRTKLDTIAEDTQHYIDRHQQIEIHNSNLANLYVASYQLHTSIDRETVLKAIQEIVINLVGSEEVAVFEPGPEGEFVLTSSFGVDAARIARFRLGDGPIGQRVRSGQIYVNPKAGSGLEQITACIPLSIGASLIGTILILRLLEHKQSLEPVDHEIFDLLAVHAATALYCATVREKLAEGAPS
jgi:hypothetical protein